MLPKFMEVMVFAPVLKGLCCIQVKMSVLVKLASEHRKGSV